MICDCLASSDAEQRPCTGHDQICYRRCDDVKRQEGFGPSRPVHATRLPIDDDRRRLRYERSKSPRREHDFRG
jgi:hypothetical protein